MVITGRNAVVRKVVANGFPPLELRMEELNYDTPVKIPASPLAVALLRRRLDCARYFISTCFFTRFDIERLCWDIKIRQHVRHFCGRESTYILHILSNKPLPLVNLSLVAISSALSQDFVSDGPNTSYSLGFIEKVESLALPASLKRALLHQTPPSGICCKLWDEIPIGETVYSPACKCLRCEGQG
ncbi:hypothetical protein RRG08_004936 [Elysia crispata]|uniref:Uncharacterized protein n=1 Tax=Elysia crispata TaxID=231223 RepID=A0AAE0ZI32_9GAST|nr:hypothetical protein RRG08_004936 [Elysia crispata]